MEIIPTFLFRCSGRSWINLWEWFLLQFWRIIQRNKGDRLMLGKVHRIPTQYASHYEVQLVCTPYLIRSKKSEQFAIRGSQEVSHLWNQSAKQGMLRLPKICKYLPGCTISKGNNSPRNVVQSPLAFNTYLCYSNFNIYDYPVQWNHKSV